VPERSLRGDRDMPVVSRVRRHFGGDNNDAGSSLFPSLPPVTSAGRAAHLSKFSKKLLLGDGVAAWNNPCDD
jgi:hypothetical protein